MFKLWRRNDSDKLLNKNNDLSVELKNASNSFNKKMYLLVRKATDVLVQIFMKLAGLGKKKKKKKDECARQA